MTIDFLHLYSRCPHCRTIFRVAHSQVEIDNGWVKCGKCHKVFDSQINEVNPVDFVKPVEPDDQPHTEPQAENTDESVDSGAISSSTLQETQTSAESVTTPQISLFETKLHNVSVEKVAEPALEQPRSAENSPKQNQHGSDLDREIQNRDLGGDIPALVTESIQSSSHNDSQGLQHSPQVNDTRSADSRRDLDISIKPEKKSPAAINLNSTQASKSKKQSEKSFNKHSSKPELGGFGLSQAILATAQNFKRKKHQIRRPSNLLPWIGILILLVMLIWQVTVVSYTKLAQYQFLQAPLGLICSALKCNDISTPYAQDFQILHASFRRHPSIPGVMIISATLINFSDEDRMLPTIRVDLFDEANTAVASKTINLADNPQYVDPTITELSPGQDVKILFNLDRPPAKASGFALSLVN